MTITLHAVHGKRAVIALLAAALAVPFVPIAGGTASAAPVCTTDWVGPTSGFAAFSAPTSWSTGRAPTAADTVCFPTGLSITLQSIGGPAVTVAGWDVAPGGLVAVQHSAPITITGEADLGGVRLLSAPVLVTDAASVSSGETLTIANGRIDPASAGATFTIEPGATVVLESGSIFGVNLENRGTISATGFFARLSMRPGTTLTNEGTIDLNDRAMVMSEPGSPLPMVRNEPGGLIDMQGPAFVPLSAGGLGHAALITGVEFFNDGTVHVRSGQGALDSPGIHSGLFQIDAGAQLGISRAVNTFGPTSTVTGDGFVRTTVIGVFETSVFVDAAATFSPAELHVTTGLTALSGQRSLPIIRLAGGGGVEVHGELTVTAELAVVPGQAARITGTGTVTIADTAEITMASNNAFFIRESAHLINEGHVRHAGPIVALENNARVTNRGTWEITNSADISLGTGTVLRNEGTITIDGVNDTQIGFSGTLDNVGTISLRSGRLDFRSTPVAQHSAGTLNGGTWEVADGAIWMGFPAITSIDDATVRLRGNASIQFASFDRRSMFDNLNTIREGGALELLDGASLDTAPSGNNGLTIEGVLALSGGGSVATRDLTVAPTGELRLELGTGAPGSFDVATSASLGGAVVATQGTSEIVEAIYPFITAASVTGAFTSVTGPGDPPVSVRRVGSVVELIVGDAPPPPAVAATLFDQTVFERFVQNGWVRIVLDEPAGAGGVTVRYETYAAEIAGDPDARPGIDFEPAIDAEITIPEGATEGRLLVTILDDDISEQPGFRLIGVRVIDGAEADPAIITIFDDDQFPTLTLSGGVAAEGDESTTMTLGLSAATLTDFDRCLGVFIVESGDATIGDDVAAAADGFVGNVTFPAGAEDIDIEITIVGDDVAETGEAFTVEVREGCNRNPVTPDVVATAEVDIIDDDTPLSGGLVPSLLTLTEGTSGAQTLQLSEVSPVDRLVQVVLTPIASVPMEPEDLGPLPDDGRFVIPAGATSIELPTFEASIDGIYEGSDYAVVQVRDGATVIAEGAVNVISIDPRPTVSIVDPAVSDGAADIREGSTNPVTIRPYEVPIRLSGPTEISLNFVPLVTGGTASPGTTMEPGIDVLLPTEQGTQVYVLPPGGVDRSIVLQIVQDGRFEEDESFELDIDLLNPGRPESTVTYRIIDDDPQLRLPQPFAFVDEGSSLPVSLDLEVPYSTDQSLRVVITAHSGTEPEDWQDTSGIVTVSAGATEVALPPVVALTDDITEFMEFLQYTVFDSAGQVVDTREVRIRNLTPIPTATIVSSTTITEGSRGITRTETITARLNRVADFDVTYPVTISGDVVPIPPASFTFPAGVTQATLRVGIVEDTIQEREQSFTITATQPDFRPVETATFTIVDDDGAVVEPSDFREVLVTEVQFDNDEAVVELSNASTEPLELDGAVLWVDALFGVAVQRPLSGTLAAGASVVVRAPIITTVQTDIVDIDVRRVGLATPLWSIRTLAIARHQIRLESGVRSEPTDDQYFEVPFGTTMGSHQFDPDTVAPTWGPAPRVVVNTTSTASTIPVTYALPIPSDNSQASTLNRVCTPAPGTSFTVGGTRRVTCTATDPHGNSSSIGFDVVVSRVSGPVLATTPAGQGIAVQGSGFIPNRPVRITLRSEPVLLAEVNANARGDVSRSLTLPANTSPGAHTITLEGFAPDGTLRLVVYTITVGSPCTITGTSRNDLIIGTPGDDVICALDGNDIVLALGGNDVVYGGDGLDIIEGGAGDDYLDGGNGFDIVIGGRGRNTLIGEIRL